MKKKNNVTEFPKFVNLNIGVIIFLFIFIYILYNVLVYFTDTHVSPYEVEHGTIATNNVYHGLVLRDETVYTTEYSGAVNYYIKEYTKAGYNDLIYTIDESGSVAERLNETKLELAGQNNYAVDEVTKALDTFKASYDSETFYQVYSIKDEVNSILNEALNMYALEEISAYADAAEGNNSFHKVRAQEAGVVCYYIDGYEHMTVDSFGLEDLDESTYKKTNLKAVLETKAGSEAYKMIHSEKWNIVLPVSEETAAEMIADLEEDNLIAIRFVKDAKEMYAEYEVREIEGKPFLILTLKNAMVRYASERFLEIELLLSEETGLKIPNTAIVEKEFYTVPKDYFLEGGDSSADGLLIESTDKDGNKIVEFVAQTIYRETEEFYYIDSENIQAGDVLQKPNSSEKYVVGTDTAILSGVYNINKGYAVFKQIEIMLQNEEYSIVKTGTSYGIALYDHIALDGTKIQEDELIK